MKLELSHYMLIGLAILVLLLAVSNFFGGSMERMENRDSQMPGMEKPDHQMTDNGRPLEGREEVAVSKNEEEENKKPRVMDMSGVNTPKPMTNEGFHGRDSAMCYPQATLRPSELLPGSNDVNQFSQIYPEGQGNLMNQNFLQSGFSQGIDTVGQTLRNANLQLRSEPPNPQIKVSPWNQTTIDPDLNRRPLEIGGCA